MNGMVRDTKTNAILNTNKEEIQRFQQMRSTEERLNTIENGMNEIRDLLKQIISEKE